MIIHLNTGFLDTLASGKSAGNDTDDPTNLGTSCNTTENETELFALKIKHLI